MVIAKSGYYHNKYTCNWHLLKPGVFYLSKWHIQTFGILTSEKPVDIIQVRKQEQKKNALSKKKTRDEEFQNVTSSTTM